MKVEKDSFGTYRIDCLFLKSYKRGLRYVGYDKKSFPLYVKQLLQISSPCVTKKPFQLFPGRTKHKSQRPDLTVKDFRFLKKHFSLEVKTYIF